MNGITITRWNLCFSLALALTVAMGAVYLLWDRANTLHATQLELVERVSRVEAQVTVLQEDVTALRGEVRDGVAGLREEIRALGDLTRARETSGVGTP